MGSELEWIVLDENELLLLDGSQGEALYFVASGRLEVVQPSKKVDGAAGNDAPGPAAIIAGDVIAEMSTGSQSSVEMRGVTAARVVKLEKTRLERYLATHPHVANRLQNIFIPLFYRNKIVQVLRSMFGDLTEDMLADIEQRLTWRYVARGDALFQQGELSAGLFVVVSGRLQELEKSDAGEERIINEIVQGEIAGEVGVFTDESQTVSLVADRDSVLLELSRGNFRELTERYPKLYEWLAWRLSILLQNVIHNTPSEHVRTSTNLLLVPAHDGAPVDEFSRHLFASLSRHASCLLLSSAQTDMLLGTTGIAQSEEGTYENLRLRAWLDSQETRFRYLIYVADSSLTNWTKGCIRQADEIISFGVATAAPNLTETEARILRDEESRRAKFRKVLVLVHPPGTVKPRGTIRWLSERHVHRHIHVRTDNQDDLDRIVRYVLRREIGLVLSGGGVRGFAHVGIIKAIREAKLPVDVVAGVSMGSLIGAGYAFFEDLDETVGSIDKRSLGRLFTDYTFPVVALARGRRFDRYLKALFGDTNIEDLWLPYSCVSSNLTRATTVVHRTGPLWRAIRASSSLPGIVPPVVDNGELLYDGGLLNNLPVDVMREEILTGSLIAVDVEPPVDLEIHAAELENPSGWRVAWSWINPFTKPLRIPNIVSILNRSCTLGSFRYRRRMIADGLVDLHLRPPLEQFRTLDFSVGDQALEIGYAYGVNEIGAWTKHARPRKYLERPSRIGERKP